MVYMNVRRLCGIVAVGKYKLGYILLKNCLQNLCTSQTRNKKSEMRTS